MKKLPLFIFIITILFLPLYFSNASPATGNNPTNNTLINGACGSVNGTTVTSMPTQNLCSSGSILTTTSIKGPVKNYNKTGWKWACNGANGGKTSSICTALIKGGGLSPTPSSTNKSNTGSNIDGSSSGSTLVPACPAGGCGFDELMKLINKVINFLLFTIAMPLAAIIFAYAGFLLITAGGDPAKVTQAKAIIKNLLIGFVIALAAWLIINTILSTLGFQGSFLTK